MICNGNWSCIGGELQLISMLGQLPLISSWQWSIDSLLGEGGGVQVQVQELDRPMERHQGHQTRFSSFWHRGIQSNAGRGTQHGQKAKGLCAQAASPFLSPLDDRQVFGLLPIIPTRAHLKTVWLSWLSKIPTAIDIVQYFQMHLLLIAQLADGCDPFAPEPLV